MIRGALSVLDMEDPRRNFIKESWDTLTRVPGGKLVFSRIIGRAARYTGSIRARITELAPQRSIVEMDDSPLVRNHLHSVHAIALANLAELAGNLALSYTLPPDGRFIVAGLSMEYVKKARGRITAEGISPEITTSERKNYDVQVIMRDASGEVVAKCTLNTLVGPKKPR